MGNLFADAILWWTKASNGEMADLSFFSTGGFRGGGWDASTSVHVSDLWQAMPFPNTVCRGVMSGLSLYKLFHFSINQATFAAHGTKFGSRLLQISWTVRLVYNTDLTSNKLVSVHIWDDQHQAFVPLDRLRLYTFVTDSYLCGGQKDFSQLTGPNFQLSGEVPGRIDDTMMLQQDIVAEYLRQLAEPYVPRIEGRLFNDTSALEPLSFIQTEESCIPGTSYWLADRYSCQPCPNDVTNLKFSDQVLHFETTQVATAEEILSNRRIVLVNR